MELGPMADDHLLSVMRRLEGWRLLGTDAAEYRAMMRACREVSAGTARVARVNGGVEDIDDEKKWVEGMRSGVVFAGSGRILRSGWRKLEIEHELWKKLAGLETKNPHRKLSKSVLPSALGYTLSKPKAYVDFLPHTNGVRCARQYLAIDAAAWTPNPPAEQNARGYESRFANAGLPYTMVWAKRISRHISASEWESNSEPGAKGDVLE
ncbi:hypothetical protein DL96DRAFT_1562258 [Flagelloscypha sp. PMI_526]|nr:hypothetical protein DL96DRAFT_1562258 [Flagelloscypha sp. PMI_526]